MMTLTITVDAREWETAQAMRQEITVGGAPVPTSVFCPVALGCMAKGLASVVVDSGYVTAYALGPMPAERPDYMLPGGMAARLPKLARDVVSAFDNLGEAEYATFDLDFNEVWL